MAKPKPRQRRVLVPKGGVEVMEFRAALYIDGNGGMGVAYEITDQQNSDPKPPLHEVLGMLEFTKAMVIEEHDRKAEDL